MIGLLHDRASYGVYGDHRVAQKSVQRVPMFFWTPCMDALNAGEEFRTPDVMPRILRAMGISPTVPMDGVAHQLGIDSWPAHVDRGLAPAFRAVLIHSA